MQVHSRLPDPRYDERVCLLDQEKSNGMREPAFHQIKRVLVPDRKYRAFRKGCTFIEHPIIFEGRASERSKTSRKIVLEAAFMVLKLRFQSQWTVSR
jgi:hypothetical protein